MKQYKIYCPETSGWKNRPLGLSNITQTVSCFVHIAEENLQDAVINIYLQNELLGKELNAC